MAQASLVEQGFLEGLAKQVRPGVRVSVGAWGGPDLVPVGVHTVGSSGLAVDAAIPSLVTEVSIRRIHGEMSNDGLSTSSSERAIVRGRSKPMAASEGVKRLIPITA